MITSSLRQCAVFLFIFTFLILNSQFLILNSAHAAAPAPTPKTGQTVSYATRDDGALQPGVAWPTPRFTDNVNGTVTDNLTGLIWLKNANCFSTQTWDNALVKSNTLASGACGLTDNSKAGDWHLPNDNVLLSLVDYGRSYPALPAGHPFTSVQFNYYWSGSTLAGDTSNAWDVSMVGGIADFSSKTINYYVWPVRSGQSGSFDSLILSVTKSGTGTGTVTSSTGGISCGSTCSATITSGTSVTLTATPDSGSTFTGWSGSCSGTGTCSVTLDAAKSVAATFALAAINGTCGSSNGSTLTVAPTANLCSAGNASTVTGSGPWSWTCAGMNGGTTATCSATISNASTPPAPVPQTGQTTCYNTAGTVIACAGTGQDGDEKAGVAWPNPRFTDNGNSTVSDNLSGLMWTKDANAPGPTACGPATTKTWQSALDYAACLNSNSYLGYNDWRVPTIREMRGLVDILHSSPALPGGHPFTSPKSNFYWSGSTNAGYTSYAWVVHMSVGYVNYYYGNKTLFNYVWPVRSEQSSSAPSPTPKTGQTISYAARDDGALQPGVAWPTSRFTDNVNGTVTDNLTGLIWLKNANCFSTQTWDNALATSNTLASGACGLTDGSKTGDWRLPNNNELWSLVDYGSHNPSISASNPFTSVQSYNYWSGSTNASGTNYAWGVSMYDGYVSQSILKSGGVYTNGNPQQNYVWPVRSGQSVGFSLTLSKTGTGAGTITPSTGTITWTNNTGTASYTSGTAVTLTATPDSGSSFTSWTGCDSTVGTACTVSMSAAKSVTAIFTDTAAPVVSTLTATPTANSLTTAITFSATDNRGVTGYYLSETNDDPVAGSTGWKTTAPTTFTFSTFGSKTLHAWAKDAANIVSALKTATVTLVDLIPTVTATTPANGAPSVPLTTTIQINFSENMNTASFNPARLLKLGNTWIPGTGFFAVGSTIAYFFNPSTPLSYATTYTVTVDSVTDLTGNKIATPYSASFTTVPKPVNVIIPTLSLALSATSTLIDNTGPVTLSGAMTAGSLNIASQPITVTLTKPDGTTLAIPLVTDSKGAFSTNLRSNLTSGGRYTVQASAGSSSTSSDILVTTIAPATSAPVVIRVLDQSGIAIIVTGSIPNAEGKENHLKTASRVKSALKARGFADADIITITSLPGNSGKTALTAALATAKTAITAKPASLHLILVDHGDKGQFHMDSEVLTP